MFDPIWVTWDGQRYRVSDMSTSHIRRCIAMIERRKNWRVQYLGRLEAELKARAMGIKIRNSSYGS